VDKPDRNELAGAALEGPAGFWDFHRALFENAPHGIVIQDASGAILNANPAAERCLGLSLDQLQGRTHIDPRWKALREDGSPFPGEFHPAMRSLRTGLPTEGVVMGVYNPRLGQTSWIEISAVPLFRQGEARPFQVLTMFLDITGRRLAEDRLREQAQVLGLFIEHAPAPIAMLDKEMRYIYASGRWLRDYRIALEDIVGRSHYEVFPEIPERWREIHRRCLAGATERCDADLFPRQDGRVDRVKWEIRPWRDRTGAVGGIIILSELLAAGVAGEPAPVRA